MSLLCASDIVRSFVTQQSLADTSAEVPFDALPCLSNHLSKDTGCFHDLTTMNEAAIIIGVHISSKINDFRFLGKYPVEGLLGNMVILVLIF